MHRVLEIPTAVRRNFLPLLTLAIGWEIVARYVVDDPLFFSPLSDVFDRGIEMWAAGELQVHVWVSFVEFTLGFLAAVVAGIGFGVVMASSVRVRTFFDPLVSMAYATPIIALGPIFILWLGIGIVSKVAIVYLTAVFPILINTVIGLTTTDRNLIEVARSLGASPQQINLKVRMPAALPYIIAGVRISVARAIVGVVVAEFFGARAGLGFLIINAAQSFDTAAVFLAVLILAVAGVLAVELVKWIEIRLAPWRFQEEGH